MNYLGSKGRLLNPLIDRAIDTLDIPTFGKFGDAFAGTNAVGRHMQRKGYTVHANDLQAYSYTIGKSVLCADYPRFNELSGHIFLHSTPVEERLGKVIAYLNEIASDIEQNYLPLVHGTWFIDKYCEGGSDGRLYFSNENGKRITVLRWVINQWRLTAEEFCVLNHAIIVAADKVANTASIYYTYLKNLKPSAKRSLKLDVPQINVGPKAEVYNLDALDFVKGVRDFRVLYLDPPYNQRQYAANYHLLETICLWDDPAVSGVGGVRPYDNQKSNWCYKGKALNEFTTLLHLCDAEYVFLSYSDEGLIPKDEIIKAMSHFGYPVIFEHEYPRFRADKDSETRKYAENDTVIEYLFVVKMK